jgi:preprotein translocase subunit SecB
LRPAEYGKFIEGLELIQVRLVRLNVETTASFPIKPSGTSVELEVTDEASYTPVDGGFEAFHRYSLLVTDAQQPSEPLGRIEAEFGLRFASVQPISQPYFEIFRHINLPVNTWPYWRELVQSMAARMGWPPVTLPLLKRGTQPAGRSTVQKGRKRK